MAHLVALLGRIVLPVACSFVWLVACSSDDAATSTTPSSTSSGGGSGGASMGVGGSAGASGAAVDDGGNDASGEAGEGDAACGGPVPTTAIDAHCATPDGGRGDSVPPHEGNEADDDNCLYHAKIGVSCIVRNADVTLTLDLKSIGTTMPATGAAPTVDGVVDYHPWPPTNPMSSEMAGLYTIGPVRFDRAGRWTLTFHVYDAAPAKHSHVSFYVDVP
jgi:hypothetical protein